MFLRVRPLSKFNSIARPRFRYHFCTSKDPNQSTLATTIDPDVVAQEKPKMPTQFIPPSEARNQTTIFERRPAKPMPSLYERLNINEETSQEDLKVAFLNEAKRTHPDVAGDDNPDAALQFKQ